MGAKPSPNRISAVVDMLTPTNTDGVSCINGKFYYLAAFLPDFAKQIRTIHQPTHRGSTDMGRKAVFGLQPQKKLLKFNVLSHYVLFIIIYPV